MQDLGTLAGGDTVAFAINATGDTVGLSRITDTVYHAFLYSDGAMKDLNSLIDPLSGWALIAARGINDAGQIAGYGRYNGQIRAFRLTPLDLGSAVPEPAAWAVMLAGFGLVGQMIRLRRRTPAQSNRVP